MSFWCVVHMEIYLVHSEILWWVPDNYHVILQFCWGWVKTVTKLLWSYFPFLQFLTYLYKNQDRWPRKRFDILQLMFYSKHTYTVHITQPSRNSKFFEKIHTLYLYITKLMQYTGRWVTMKDAFYFIHIDTLFLFAKLSPSYMSSLFWRLS